MPELAAQDDAQVLEPIAHTDALGSPVSGVPMMGRSDHGAARLDTRREPDHGPVDGGCGGVIVTEEAQLIVIPAGHGQDLDQHAFSRGCDLVAIDAAVNDD